MLALLCVLAFSSLQGDLKPLPETKKLTDVERVALEYARLEADTVGLLGWTRTQVDSCQLDGAPHILVHRTAELLDFEAPGFVAVESRGLYTAELELVHERRQQRLLGGKALPLELEWTDDGFRWREGGGPWSSGPAGVRPTAETDVALLVHGTAIETPWVAQVFDDTALKLEAKTLQPGKPATVDGAATVEFDVAGPTPAQHRLSKEGVYLGSTMGPMRIAPVRGDGSPEAGLREALADNESFEAAVDQNVPLGWTEKKEKFSHAVLGMSLKLPKGWKRVPSSETGGAHFFALSADGNAFGTLAIIPLGTGYPFASWSEAIVETCRESAVGGKVKSKKKRFAGQEALQLEYVENTDAPLDTTGYLWKHNGFGFYLSAGAWIESPKKLLKEAGFILRSVKIER